MEGARAADESPCRRWRDWAILAACMVLPEQPVTLTPEQIADLNRKLSAMRHDINNYLSLIMAAVEMIRLKPEDAPRRLATLADQPARISQAMAEFSAEFEKAMGIQR